MTTPENIQEVREKALIKATKTSQKAQSLLDELNTLLAKCEKALPISYGLTKAQKTKQQSPNGILERLKLRADTLRQLKSDYAWIDCREKETAIATARTIEDKKRNDDKEARKVRAIAFCLKHGISVEEVGSVGSIVELASGIAYDLAIKDACEHSRDSFITFSGHNCEGPCAGWNLEDHHCQCGNRRVAWTCISDDFENIKIAAEAY